MALFFGTAFILAGIYFLVTELDVRINGARTKAVVAEFTYTCDRESAPVTYPVFEYTVGRQTHKVRRRYGSGLTRLRVGSEVEIIYHPRKPELITVKNDYSLYIWPVLFIATGTALIVFREML